MAQPGPPELLPWLLELHKHGRPPFLVRNLHYVKVYKKRARQRLFDLTWTTPSYRPEHSPRHLILTTRPSRCILEEGVTAKLLHPERQLPRYTYPDLYNAPEATLRVSLCVRQENGHVVSFGARDMSVRVWPREHEIIFRRHGRELADLPCSGTFDLSAVLPVLGSEPAVLALVVEAFSRAFPTSSNARAPLLRGEVVVWDRQRSKHGTVIPNGLVTVPLHLASRETSCLPGELSSDVESAVRLEDEVRQPGDDDDIRMRDLHIAFQENQHSGTKDAENGNADGSVSLELVGCLRKGLTEEMEKKPHVSVRLIYTSPEVPSWDGIERSDFVCPWCHRNCHRYRTLLAHFQVEHDDMKFSLQGTHRKEERSDESFTSIPFTLTFKVRRLSVGLLDDGACEGNTSSDNTVGNVAETRKSSFVFTNPNRYKKLTASGRSRGQEREEEVTKALDKVNITDNEVESDGASTECDDDREMDFLSMIHTELGENCKYCFRQHQKSYNGMADFCSEWCEIMLKKHHERAGSDVQDWNELEPLSSHASVQRPRKVNYKEALGKLKLYHVVSVSEAKPEHFDEDDPDSEEEVDQSWRLDLSLERVRHLEGVSPKEKILWMMWNKFAHENYPIPSVYAERYTRYTLELFALEYGEQIKRYRLRVQLVGFLRALHVHGLIDTVAIKSIMLCLDGKKKRRDITISSRPELPKDVPSGNGRAGSGRLRKLRKP